MIYSIQVSVDDEAYDGADEVISAIDANIPEGMEVISAEIMPGTDGACQGDEDPDAD